MVDVDAVKQILAGQDEEFRRWNEEHHRYEERLSQLITKPDLTPEEEFEEKSIKKMKLALKDRMQERIRTAMARSA